MKNVTGRKNPRRAYLFLLIQVIQILWIENLLVPDIIFVSFQEVIIIAYLLSEEDGKSKVFSTSTLYCPRV